MNSTSSTWNKRRYTRDEWRQAWVLARKCADKLEWETVAGDVWWLPAELLRLAWSCYDTLHMRS